MDKIKKYLITQFEQSVGYTPNIDNPKTFNEKIQWLKLYYRDPLMTLCADKYSVRKYIKEKIGDKHLIPLINSYNKVEEIDFDKLPNKFVLKVNNGAGRNIFCKNKKVLNIEETKNKLNEWLNPKNSYYFYSYEWVYKNIKPKIVCEKYIEQNNHDLYDYKFYYFHGKLKFIRTFRNRFLKIEKNTYDSNWNPLDISIGGQNSNIQTPKPNNLNDMIKISHNLAKNFPFVRVDLYEVNNHVYFSELTFYPAAGLNPILPSHYDYVIGKYLNINKIISKQVKDYLNYKKTRKANTAIYTSISGKYDTLEQPLYISKDFDYICFTNNKIKKPGVWEIRPLLDVKQDLIRTARYHKLFPDKLLKKYKYSIWIDSNIIITSNNLENKIKKLIRKNKKISVNNHFERDCIYQEAKTCVDLQKDNPEIILKQVNYLQKQNYPKKNGLFETNIIFREHYNKKIIKTMNNWWWMIKKYSRRDQLSFNYVVWKNKLNCSNLFPYNARLMIDDFIFKEHNKQVVSTVYVDSGNGFNDDNFFQKVVTINSNKYKISLNLNKYEKINKIKFNPIKNNFCQFKIEKINIDNKTYPISKLKYKLNGKILENGYFDFSTTSDPLIIFSLNRKKIKLFKIFGIIIFFNTENLYINLIKEKDNLLKDLYKIQSSRTYKIWQRYNNILKKIKIKQNN